MAHYRRTKKVLARAKKIYHNELEEIRKSIKDVESVKLSFYPDHYDPSRNANGGSYISYEKFYNMHDGEIWEKHYGTSADFDYCPVNGNFTSCNSCPDWDNGDNKSCGCVGKYEIISTKELIKYIYECLKQNERSKETDSWCTVEYFAYLWNSIELQLKTLHW